MILRQPVQHSRPQSITRLYLPNHLRYILPTHLSGWLSLPISHISRSYSSPNGAKTAADPRIRKIRSCIQIRKIPGATPFSWITPTEVLTRDEGGKQSRSRGRLGVFNTPLRSTKRRRQKRNASPAGSPADIKDKYAQKTPDSSGNETSLGSSSNHASNNVSKQLTHLDSKGHAHMVDIAGKPTTDRFAAAEAFVIFSNPKPYASLTDRSLPKGDALAIARVAGIQATKKTADLIPLAHPSLNITHVGLDIKILEPAGIRTNNHRDNKKFRYGGVRILAHVSCEGKTGVEMEALTGASTSALTIYDMCKAVDQQMEITGLQIHQKRGGKRCWPTTESDIPDDPFRPRIYRDEDLHDRPDPSDSSNSDTTASASSMQPASSLADLLVCVPEEEPSFFQTASQEHDLFVANTNIPAKAAEISSLRSAYKAFNQKIRALQLWNNNDEKPPRIDALHFADALHYICDKQHPRQTLKGDDVDEQHVRDSLNEGGPNH